jgi:hypothetical protein
MTYITDTSFGGIGCAGDWGNEKGERRGGADARIGERGCERRALGIMGECRAGQAAGEGDVGVRCGSALEKVELTGGSERRQLRRGGERAHVLCGTAAGMGERAWVGMKTVSDFFGIPEIDFEIFRSNSLVTVFFENGISFRNFLSESVSKSAWCFTDRFLRLPVFVGNYRICVSEFF